MVKKYGKAKICIAGRSPDSDLRVLDPCSHGQCRMIHRIKLAIVLTPHYSGDRNAFKMGVSLTEFEELGESQTPNGYVELDLSEYLH
ncbi:hypothetical protein N7486_001601 [Penicillium sp. IBT 16267x]|nr:hypothetical protein N7486_001601 [Penicillium sp. IBT 16267x]